ncbi:MAG TPA: adenylosuccinate lyase [Actinomycetota bacterium]|nr:adenylosuccinate lyase [Actinomycetota bacterium]
MIPRYTLPEMGAVWSDRTRLDTWLRIEILACEAWARLGHVPESDLEAIRAATVTAERVEELERVTNHDVAAFVQAAAESVGEPGRWIHFGMTSSDLLDTGLAVQLRTAADLLLGRLETLLSVVKRRALEHRDTVCVGRTHGVIAEPTTFGHKLAVWAFELARNRERMRRAREVASVGKVSGVVGTYAAVDPLVEEHVCRELGLAPAEAATQVVQRDRHAEFLSALAVAGATAEKMALEVRHLARTEVREVQEPFGKGQKGSSAMPHKRNPILCERVTGIARLLRANAHAGLENVALWHERDISHSSVERVILPDSTILLDYQLHLMTRIIDGLHVFPDRMRANLAASGGLVYSQPVLLALIDRGLGRDEAYDVVQTAAAAAWDRGADFRAELRGDPRMPLSEAELDALFEPRLEHLDAVFARVEKLDVAEPSPEGATP